MLLSKKKENEEIDLKRKEEYARKSEELEEKIRQKNIIKERNRSAQMLNNSRQLILDEVR